MPEPIPASVAAPEAAVKESADATISAPTTNSAVDMTVPAGEKMLAILGYIGFLCILPIVLKPKSEMCQHHGKQALAVTLMFFIATGTLLTLTLLAGSVKFLYILTAFVNIAWAAVAVLGIMGAAAGKKNSLPFFSTIAKRFTW